MMNKLTQAKYERARNYLKKGARCLEREIFEHHFEGGSAEAVLTHLAEFQNLDGGFGNALEPDLRSPSSSALATEYGLRTMVEYGVRSDHAMVRAAVTYVLDTMDEATSTWRVAPLDVNKHPHAPWWHDSEGSLARTFDDFLVIPRAGIIAQLYHYSDLLPSGWLERVTQTTMEAVKTMEEEKFGGGGDALNYLRKLAETPQLPLREKDWLVQRVRELAKIVVARDPEQWTSYCAPPVKLAPTPEAITAEVLADYLPAHLDYLISQQSPQGYWDVTWSWSDYPDVWEVAKAEWRGILTVDTLISLKAYGRIEL
jgi:hypothetical protein